MGERMEGTWTTENPLETKVLDIASKHPEFDEKNAKREILILRDCEVVQDLYVLYQKLETMKPGNKNPLNSWLAYYMGVTTQKPNGEFNIEKRRTYGRSGFPDIDMDFDYMRRHEVVEYLIDKYGRDQVGNIGTIQTLKTKAALRRVIKVLDPTNTIRFDKNGKREKSDENTNFLLENEILRTLPTSMRREDGTFIKTVREAYNEYPEFRRYMDKYDDVRFFASRVEGSISSFGCLSKDTTILTKEGYVRIDQLDGKAAVAYIDKDENISYTNDYLPHKTGVKKCYKMKLSNGCWIKVTDEHLMFTDKGCVFFEEIRKNPGLYKILSIKK